MFFWILNTGNYSVQNHNSFIMYMCDYLPYYQQCERYRYTDMFFLIVIHVILLCPPRVWFFSPGHARSSTSWNEHYCLSFLKYRSLKAESYFSFHYISHNLITLISQIKTTTQNTNENLEKKNNNKNSNNHFFYSIEHCQHHFCFLFLADKKWPRFFFFPHENFAAPNCWWEIDELMTRRREKIGFFLEKVEKVPKRNWQKKKQKRNWIKLIHKKFVLNLYLFVVKLFCVGCMYPIVFFSICTILFLKFSDNLLNVVWTRFLKIKKSQNRVRLHQ